jgi:uncharacterized membrane protein YphA (DoxX/SURF4 family)
LFVRHARALAALFATFTRKKSAVARKAVSIDQQSLNAAVMDWKTAARLFFAVTLIAIGVMALADGGFAPIWRPVPDGAPARELLAYLSSLVALGCGAGLLAKRSATPAALVFFLFLSVWTLLFKFPFIVRAPLVEGSYQANGENWVLIAAAWLLYAELSKSRNFLSSGRGVRLVYALYGLGLIAFGLSHFFYLELTAPLVPSWLPGPVFWAYATGTIYTACGLALVIGFAPRLAALGAAVNITLITVLVWGPMVAAGGLTPMHLQETIVSWALTAAALVLATGSPPATAAYLSPSRRRRSA